MNPSTTLVLKGSLKTNYNTRMVEYFLYDQFSDGLMPLIEDNETTNSICGYTAITNAVKAAEFYSKGLNCE